MRLLTTKEIEEQLKYYKELLMISIGTLDNCNNYNYEKALEIFNEIEIKMRNNDPNIYPFINSNYNKSNLSYVLYILYLEKCAIKHKLEYDLTISEYYIKHREEIISNWLALVKKLKIDGNTPLDLRAKTINEILLSQWNISDSVFDIKKQIQEQIKIINLYSTLYYKFLDINEPYSIYRSIDKDDLMKKCALAFLGKCDKNGSITCVEECEMCHYNIVSFPCGLNNNGRSKIISMN